MRRRLPVSRRVLLWIALAVGVAVVTLLAPATSVTGLGRMDPSSFNTGPWGVSGFSEVAARLGWPVEKRRTPDLANIGDEVLISLRPQLELTPRETHVLLDAVRRGAGLLASPSPASPLADSLYLFGGSTGSGRASEVSERTIPSHPSDRACKPTRRNVIFNFLENAYMPALPHQRGTPLADSAGENLLTLNDPIANRDSSVVIGARGIHYGAGRIVVLSAPTPLQNDVLRRCTIDAARPAVKILEFLSPTGKRRLVFDEYRHGYGAERHIWSTVGQVFTTTATGRGLLQLVAAGLILVTGAAVRELPPRRQTTIERRSPFEHIDALAAAYSRAGATTLATRRLVRGLRRRLSGSLPQGAGDTDESFLDSLAARNPAILHDVALVQNALRNRVASTDFLAVGNSIACIERSIKA